MKTSSDAFTPIDFLASFAGIALMVMAAYPLFANSKPDSSRAACFNNLRQIGHGAQVWGNEHNDRVPWITPLNEGGTQPVLDGGNGGIGRKVGIAWLEFTAFSNELVNPRVFACPSDNAVKVASHWGNSEGGFVNSGFRGNALSYFVSYHCQPEMPRSVVSGDRDFGPLEAPTGCSRGIINGRRIVSGPGPFVAWTNAVHPGAGHLLFADGSVEYVASAKLQDGLVGTLASENGLIHIVNAR